MKGGYNGTRQLIVGGRRIRAQVAKADKGRGGKPAPTVKLIKLQLDYRTVVTVRHQSAAEMWMERFPNAKILA